MKILQPILNNLSILGVQSYQKHPFNLRNVNFFFMLSTGSVLNCVHLFCEANTFKEYADSVCASSSMIVATIMFAIALWKTQPISRCLNELEEIVEMRLKCSASKEIYDGINDNVRKMDNILDVFIMKFLFPCVMFSKFITCYFAYFTTDLGNQAFELPFPYWFPFDWKTPTGYLMAFTLQTLICLYLFFYLMSAFSMGIAMFMLMTLMIKDIQVNLNSIDECLKSKIKRTHISVQYSDTINFHSIVKQLIRDTSKITQPWFMVIFSWCIIAICGGMLMIRMQISRDTSNFVILIASAFELFAAFMIVFISCELAGRLSEQFDNIEYTMGQFKWYLFPLETKRILPIVLLNAQQPVHLKCIGSVPCDRETFKKVLNCGFSYFMTLRAFGK